MAPPKPQTEIRRKLSAEIVEAVIAGTRVGGPQVLDALSEVKGLFSRIARQDQWDWFSVCAQLGYPSRRIARVIANELGKARTALDKDEPGEFEAARQCLSRLPTRRCLLVMLRRLAIQNEVGAGWLYLLSTREARDLAKIGLTSRTVEERVKEINGATGVAIPYGVRGCWRVRDPLAAERLVHAALADYRIRNDREFFRVPFGTANNIIVDCLLASGLELRTLDNLGALATGYEG